MTPTRNDKLEPGLWSLTALGAIFVFHAISQVVWLAQDDSLLINTDARHHFALLRTAFELVSTDGIAALPVALEVASLGGRPPLYALIAAPFFASLGRSEDAAVLVNLLFAAIMLGATWRIAARCRGPASGLLAGFLVLCYPPVTQLFHTFLPHAALPGCVALSTALLVELFERRSIGVCWALGASIAFGLLVHPSFAWVMAGPAALVVLWVLFTSERRTSDSLATSGASRITRRISAALASPLFIRGLLPAGAAPWRWR